jgi:CheY-like chemotaxis protein
VLYPLSYGGRGGFEPSSHGICVTCHAPVVTESKPRVLVVDDDQVIRQLIGINLELEGFEVHMAADGEEALQQVVDVQPDVVVLDVMMPRLDGLEVARRLRLDPRTRDLRLVLVSARAQAADLQRGEDMGVDAYITKPFEPDELVEVVRRLAGA